MICVVGLENNSLLFYLRDGRSNVFPDGVFVPDCVCSRLAYSANSYISEPCLVSVRDGVNSAVCASCSNLCCWQGARQSRVTCVETVTPKCPYIFE